MTEKINFPELPKSWDELTTRQVTGICRIRRTPDLSHEEYMLRVFCLLMNITLPIKGEALPHTTDEAVSDNPLPEMRYLFRRLDESGHEVGTYFAMEAWELQFFVSEYLKFIDDDCNRLQDLYPKVTLGGRTYSSSGYAMAGMTYQQHTIVQRYVAEYYRLCEQARQMAEKVNGSNASLASVKQQIKQVKQHYKVIDDVRCKMLAAFFTPESRVTDKMVDGKQVHYDPPQTDYIFSTDQIEREWRHFRKFPTEKTDAVLMLYGGVMLHYKKLFPLLFKDNGGRSTDFIDMEQGTLNALQSELHFANYQSIYDSNAPFILGKLHEIVKKAKSIEEANLRMKAKSHG